YRWRRVLTERRRLQELDEFFFAAGKNFWPPVNQRAFGMVEKFLDGHGAKPPAILGVDTNVMDDANADIIGDVALDLGAGARFHTNLERQMRFAKSAIDNFSRGGSRLRQHQWILGQVFHPDAALFSRQRMAVWHDHAQLGRHQWYFFQIRQELIEQAHGEIGLAEIDRGRCFLVATSEDG